MSAPLWGLSPGEEFVVSVWRYRKWWQLWKPRRWLEKATAVAPGPAHFNCRCTIKLKE